VNPHEWIIYIVSLSSWYPAEHEGATSPFLDSLFGGLFSLNLQPLIREICRGLGEEWWRCSLRRPVSTSPDGGGAGQEVLQSRETI
jgi:hypothetical protein